MIAQTLLAELQARGVTLEPRGEKLAVRPVSKLTPQEMETLKAYKTEIMAILTLPTTATLPGVRSWVHPWPVSLPGLGRYRVETFEVCGDCSCGTWSRYGALALCFRCATARANLTRD